MASTPSTRRALAGTFPTGSAANLATVPLTILPGFPNTAASTTTAFPFGIWFADATTLYVCDEGDGTLVTPAVNGNVADAQSLATAGLQKWSLIDGTWVMQYVLQDGLNIGVPYGIDALSHLAQSGNRRLPQHRRTP